MNALSLGGSSPAGEELRSCLESWSHGNGTPPLAPPYMGFSITSRALLLDPALLPESTAEPPSADGGDDAAATTSFPLLSDERFQETLRTAAVLTVLLQ